MGFIYKINNTDNEKVYIGQTKKSIKARWCAHKHLIQLKRLVKRRMLLYQIFHML